MPARLFRHRIRPERLRVLLALFAVALTVPLLVMATFALNRMADLEKAETERRVMQVARNIANEIDRELDRATVVLETLATSTALKHRDLSAFHAQAVLALRRTKSAIVLVDRSYRQIIDTLTAFGTELPATADPETAQRVIDTKERQVSDLFRGSISGRPVFNVEVPVLEDGHVVFVLIMSFQASYLSELIRSAGLEPPWVGGITDNRGVILARSERHDDFVGQPLPVELLSQSLRATTVYRGTSIAGDAILRATVRSHIAGWLVSATVPVSHADAPLRRSRVFAAGMIGTALALGVGLAYIFAGFMARPLTSATASAAAIGKGATVEPLTSPLAEANQITEALAAASAELNRRRAHSEFLMRELTHRAKNQLAVVKGMALQTAKQSGSVEEFAGQLTQRLQGLAQSQDVLVRQDWQGAWLSDLVRAHLELFAAADRAELDGPPVFIDALAVQNIGFALHELATNAFKHGALSRPQGGTLVRWRGPSDGRIVLEWIEREGPIVDGPLRKGFGHLVLTHLVAQALQGTSHLEFGPKGVRWRLEFPVNTATKTPALTVGDGV